MYDRILVPTDGGEQALRAAEHGLYLAGEFDATLHVLHVVDGRDVADGLDGEGSTTDRSDGLEARGRRAIADVRSLAPEEATVRTALRHGTPAEEILDYVDTSDIDLVTMGTHGRTGVDRFVTGSVTEQVVRHAPVPVLTVRVTDQSDVTAGYDDVLVPTDGSDAATAAVEHGVAIAEETGAEVHALSVVEVGDMVVEAEDAPPEEAVADLEAEGERAAEDVATRAKSVGLDVSVEVREGYPDDEILTFTEENDVDCIVMGTTGRTGLSRYLLGSTTERVIRHAPVAVLAVNARDTEPR